MAPIRIKPAAVGPGGLPAYTKAQLAQVRPGLDYGQYWGYLKKQRAGLPDYNPNSGLTSLVNVTNSGVMTPAQLAALAAKNTAQNLAASRQIIADQYKNERALALQAQQRAQANALATMQAQSEAGRAAAQLNTDLLSSTQNAYNTAASDLAGLAQGGTQDIAATTAANTAKTNAALAALGMPSIDAYMAGPNQPAVARYQAGLGAESLAGQGVANRLGLAGMIAAQNAGATQQALANQQAANLAASQTYGDALAQAMRTRSSALAELIKSRPALAAQFLNQLQTSNRQQIALASSLIQQQQAAGNAAFQRYITRKRLTQDIKAQNAAIDARNKELDAKLGQIDMATSQAKGYAVDQAGNPVLDANGKQISWKDIAKRAALANVNANRELNAKLSQIDLNTSATLGYAVDQQRNPILQNGKRIPWSEIAKRLMLTKPKKGGGNPPSLTPNQMTILMQKGKRALDIMFYGTVPDPSKKGHSMPTVDGAGFDPNRDPRHIEGVTGLYTYQQAAQRLLNMGLPAPFALSLLNVLYIRGGARGRPWLSSEERAAAVKAIGKPRVDHLVKTATDLMKHGQYSAAQQVIDEVLNGTGGWPSK